MICPCLGVEDGAKERRGGEMKGEKEETEEVLIGEMGREAIEMDLGGGTMQSMVKGNVGGLELIGNGREGSREVGEEGKLEVSLAEAEDKAQVRAEPLAKGEVEKRGKGRREEGLKVRGTGESQHWKLLPNPSTTSLKTGGEWMYSVAQPLRLNLEAEFTGSLLLSLDGF